jgi:hypothetical protein
MNLEWITLLVTIAVAIPGFIILRKESKTKLIFIEEDKINFYEKIVKDFKDISIEFKGKPINEKFFLLRGFFFCLGGKDIIRENIIKPIHIKLKGQSVWRYAKIISTSEGLDVKEDGEQTDTLSFNVPLMKNRDFIYFEALGEAEDENYIPSYRIANVPPIKRKKSSFLQEKYLYLFMSIMSLTMVLGLMFSTFKAGVVTPRTFDVVPYYVDSSSNKPRNPVFLPDTLSDSLLANISKYDFLFKKYSRPYKISSKGYIQFKYHKPAILYWILILFIVSLILVFIAIRIMFRIWNRHSYYQVVSREIEKRKSEGP